jgi:hypothetical protein
MRIGKRYRAWRAELLFILAIVSATLILFLLFFAIARSASRGPPGGRELPLVHHELLEVSIIPGCPPAMPKLPCWDHERQFPRVFEVAYWLAGKKVTLVSGTLSRR